MSDEKLQKGEMSRPYYAEMAGKRTEGVSDSVTETYQKNTQEKEG